jgi:MFS family permease
VLFSINLVNNVLEKVYPDQADEFTISAITSSVVVVRLPLASCVMGEFTHRRLHHLQGTLIGQLLFGMVADQLGRKLMFVTTMALVIVGTLGSSLLSWNVWIISVFFCLGTELLRVRTRDGTFISTYHVVTTLASVAQGCGD